ncbi:class F sortase [Candidatus Saccharibacteria bacterium]|nr:class F sortase [Candidatus Saccharibacteria bacterium]
MQRRYVLSSILATFVAVIGVYVNVWASTEPVSSSIVNPVAVQEQHEQETTKTAVAKADSQQRTQTVMRRSSTPTPTPTPTPSRAISIKGDSISIPSIGLQAPVTKVGVTSTNAIDVPADVRVGHWIGSATPGASGAVFLDGHVDGVFAHLHSVKKGQMISVTYGKKQFKYRIVHTETVLFEAVDMAKALSVYGGDVEGLNIMTCAGKYDTAIGTYDHRLVVYAVRDF